MSPAQCLKARTLLNWTPADLARAAGVSVITVRNFEAGKGRRMERLAPILMKRALEESRKSNSWPVKAKYRSGLPTEAP